MARFTQAGTATNGSAGDFVQLSSTYAGGAVNLRVYAGAAINYSIGEYASSAAVVSGGKVNIISATAPEHFGPVDPKQMWIRSNGVAASILYWDTLA
jgi:hypothetical protein